MRNFLRKITPGFALHWYRLRKKSKTNRLLQKSKEEGDILSKSDIVDDLRSIGIEEGDTLLVHSSMSKIGYLEHGPETIVSALLEVVGSKGNVLMPNSPNPMLQLDYIQKLKLFDVENSPSALGAITEFFRKLPEAKRSAHPTEPVSCIGPDSDYFVGDHFGCLTPYTDKSPFYRVAEKGGKILYIGVTLDNAGTSLHTLEDAVEDFKYPVYFKDTFIVDVKFKDGSTKQMETKVHNPEQSAKRKCDGLIPMFEKEGVLRHVKIGNADTLLLDAKGMFDCMLREYNEHGVTMYTPNGV